MKRLIVVAALLCVAPLVRAEDDKDKKIEELTIKVTALEKRVDDMEKLLGPLRDQARQTALRPLFEKRLSEDAKKYKPEQLREAEQLYQTMNRNWRSAEGKAALAKMIEKYPDINRTGCAELYLGQVSDGDEKVEHLQNAIDKHSDCIYGDGVQVGAYARYLLAMYYKEKGDSAKAKTLLDEIRKDYPEAVDHSGKLLEEQMRSD